MLLGQCEDQEDLNQEDLIIILTIIIYNSMPASLVEASTPLADSSPGESRERRELEEMYSRFGWKWAVLACMAARVIADGKQLPTGIVRDLTLARASIESGCHSLCEVAADLRDLEIRLFTLLLDVSEGGVHAMLELIGKAMNGTIQEQDIDLSPLRPVLVDCAIPRICLRSSFDGAGRSL